MCMWQALKRGQPPSAITVLEMRLNGGYLRRNIIVLPGWRGKDRWIFELGKLMRVSIAYMHGEL